MIRREDSLEYHSTDRPGKIELRATKPCLTPRDLRLAYLPGALFPSREIAGDPSAVFRYTARGNLVAVVTDGTAVPGLGDVGPAAAKPMIEGTAILFKKLADIDVFDLELKASDPDRFVETVSQIEPTFGAIMLKDIRAPEGLFILERLGEVLTIPVYHENLHSTAVVAGAALINALDIVGKAVGDVRIVLCGAGTVGIGCARLLLGLGVNPANLFTYDVHGLLHPDRGDLHDHQRALARADGSRSLEEGIRGADVFIGASAGGVVTQEMIRAMARFPIVFALATPDPEIGYEEARASRRDVIVATGLPQHPNAVVDVLSFPYILRGALDVQATRITEGMLIAAARVLADLAREEVPEPVERAYGNQRFTFGPEYILPRLIDPRILVRGSAAVARQAIAEGVAVRPVEDAAYQASLGVRIGTGRETLRRIAISARQEKYRVVFPEGANETVLRACGILSDEGIATPILLGREEEIRRAIERLGLDLGGVSIEDPARSARLDEYADRYFALRCRRGVIRAGAEQQVRQSDTYAAMMVHGGHADMMVAGVSMHYPESLRTIVQVIGPAEGIRRISSHFMILLPRKVVFMADCAVNIDPNEQQLAEIALLAARTARDLGFEPRVAMLSFSSFGSVDHPMAARVRRATQIARDRAPDLIIDGEMQLSAALSEPLRAEFFPFSRLDGEANVLVVPDLQSGSLALHTLQYLGDAIPVGPLLMGTRMPVHVMQYGASVEEVVNLTTVGIVEAAALKRSPSS